MGWLTTANDTNKIVDSYEPLDEQLYNLTTLTQYVRHNVLEHYRYVGMTETAAETARAALHDPDNGVTASVQRENEGGAYQIVVVKWTLGEWEEA
jgi:hypothetical protein